MYLLGIISLGFGAIASNFSTATAFTIPDYVKKLRIYSPSVNIKFECYYGSTFQTASGAGLPLAQNAQVDIELTPGELKNSIALSCQAIGGNGDVYVYAYL